MGLTAAGMFMRSRMCLARSLAFGIRAEQGPVTMVQEFEGEDFMYARRAILTMCVFRWGPAICIEGVCREARGSIARLSLDVRHPNKSARVKTRPPWEQTRRS